MRRIEFDKELVGKLASVGCTDHEIGMLCGVSEATVKRRARRELDLGRANLKKGLRRKQVEVAMRGNVGMLIWLGKQYLGQRERQDITHTTGETKIEELSDEQLAAIAARGLKRATKATNGKKKPH